MIKKKRIVFIINTEFGLLISYLLYLERYFNYDSIFILLKSNDQRFKNINTSILPGNTIIIKNDILNKTFLTSVSFTEIKKYRPIDELVWQTPGDTLSHMISNYYKKHNISETIVTDSIASDFKMDMHIKIKTILKRISRKIINPWLPIPLKVMHYDSLKKDKIRLIALNNTLLFKKFLSTNLILCHINKHLQALSKLFNYQTLSNKSIIFFTQPINTNNGFSIDLQTKYDNFIKILTDYASTIEKPLIIKVHPGETVQKYKSYNSKFVTVEENNNIPSEIILNQVSDCLILSMWSSVSVFDVDLKNKHLWLYPLIEYKLNVTNKYRHIVTIFDFNHLFNIIKSH